MHSYRSLSPAGVGVTKNVGARLSSLTFSLHQRRIWAELELALGLLVIEPERDVMVTERTMFEQFLSQENELHA